MLIESAATGFGIILVSVNGWLVNNWVHNHLVLTIAVGVCIPFFCTIQESYRWYFSKG